MKTDILQALLVELLKSQNARLQEALEKAKKFYDQCVDADSIHGFDDECCPGCCPECGIPGFIRWLWPELAECDESPSEENIR